MSHISYAEDPVGPVYERLASSACNTIVTHVTEHIVSYHYTPPEVVERASSLLVTPFAAIHEGTGAQFMRTSTHSDHSSLAQASHL